MILENKNIAYKKTKFLVWSFLLFGFFQLKAQSSSCNSLRYENYCFSSVDSTMNIFFHRDTSITGKEVELRMDVFMPANDHLTIRPLIVMAHGGGFFGGDKVSLHHMAIELAKRGYVTASINYRLIDDILLREKDYLKAFSFAIEDMIHAISLFKDNAKGNNDFGIDTNLIFVSGISAGGVIATNLNFIDTASYSNFDDIESYKNIVELIAKKNYKQPMGCVNFSGALQLPSVMDINDPPILSYHNAFDDVVPCENGISVNSPYKGIVFGSCYINSYLDSIGHLKHKVNIDDKSKGHITYLNRKTKGTAVFQEMSGFLKEIICEYYESHKTTLPNFELKLISNGRQLVKLFPIKIPDHEFPYIEIYSSKGQLVYNYFSSNKYELGINNTFMKEGIYLIKIKSSIDQVIQKIYITN